MSLHTVTEGADAPGTAEQSHSQLSAMPFGSSAARFKIRSAKTLTTKDLRKKSFFFEGGKVEDSSQKSDPSKDLNKACTSSASDTHTNTDDKDTGNTLSKDSSKDSTFPISSEKADVSSMKFNTQEDKSQAEKDRSRGDELRRSYQSNKSKSLDWKAGHGNRTGMTSGTRDFENCMRRSNFERTGTNNKITSFTQENQPSSVSQRIQTYYATNKGNQNSDRKDFSGSPSVRMNSGQSLPSRLKPRLSHGSIGEGISLWAQQQGESSLGQTVNRMRSSNAKEITGNQTIMERDSIRLKRSNTVSSDESYPKSMDTVDCTPRHIKYIPDYVFGASLDCTDIHQEKPSYNGEKAGTFPRGFSKAYSVPKQEPSTNRENRNYQRDSSSGLSFSVSSKPKLSTEMSSAKKTQSLLPDDKEGTSRMWFTGSSKYCCQSLERTRSRLSATAQCNARRNQPDSSSISRQGVKNLFTTSGGIKEEIGEDKHPLASKGGAHNEIPKEEEKDNVFMFKTEGRRGDGVLEKSRLPSSDSVKNTISMFESLAQRSRSTPEIFRSRRTLSVPEPSRPAARLKKSDSEINLNFGRVGGNKESLRTNFSSNSTLKERPTLEQPQDTCKKSLKLAPALKQINEPRTDQLTNVRDEDERRTVDKKHMDEPDSTTTAPSGLRNIATEEKARIQPISQQSNPKSLLKQKSIYVQLVDDDENTPTDSADRASLTVNIQQQSSPGAITVNGNNPKALPNPPQSSTPTQTIYSSLNNSNNNNYETTRKDLTSTRMDRRRSDEEDDYEETDTDEDSDSGESSVTITSNMSQSERKSFSLSLVELCNYGGVDYKPSDECLSEGDDVSTHTRSASMSSDISAFSSVTLLSTEELDSLIDDVRGLGDDTLKKYEDVQVVVLHKEVGSGLGFTLAGGVDQNKPVTVHRVIPGGVAAQEGTIFEGAQVLSINGTALQNSAHWDALHTLRKARGQGMAVVVLQSSNNRKEDTEKSGITGSKVHVILNKSSSDLGFSLEGGVGSSSGDKPLTVKKIFRGGPVNEVFPGDELLEVQGQSLVGLMRLEAWSLIKKLPSGPVEVLLHRPQ
ncbi:uncharacterized protein LOC128030974 [Carassius gibelio]|uniref:uncharacterized protein LOC128030974 n=1 Tax=Carassius gibelio TaxID=101364 RepID=UPI002279ACBC|nr:uncharacterized protein LOC128030974 [Carassius gibelio]